MNKSISYSDLCTYGRCARSFHDRMINGWQPPTFKEAVANALHAIAQHSGDMARAARQVQEQLNMLSEEDRLLAQLELAARAPKVAAMVAAEPDAIREKVFRWKDEVSGWIICAKPDRVRLLPDGPRAQLLEITDYKDTDYVGGRLKKQLYFFAMVLSKAIPHTGRIKMVVERFKEPRPDSKPVDVFHYSHHYTRAELEKLRQQLAMIDTYLEQGWFPAKGGWYCEKCPLHADCKERKEYDEQKSALGRTPLVVVPESTPALPVPAEEPAA